MRREKVERALQQRQEFKEDDKVEIMDAAKNIEDDEEAQEELKKEENKKKPK